MRVTLNTGIIWYGNKPMCPNAIAQWTKPKMQPVGGVKIGSTALNFNNGVMLSGFLFSLWVRLGNKTQTATTLHNRSLCSSVYQERRSLLPPGVSFKCLKDTKAHVSLNSSHQSVSAFCAAKVQQFWQCLRVQVWYDFDAKLHSTSSWGKKWEWQQLWRLPMVAESWQGTWVSEKLQGQSQLEVLKHPSITFVVLCARQCWKLSLVPAWGHRVGTPEGRASFDKKLPLTTVWSGCRLADRSSHHD